METYIILLMVKPGSEAEATDYYSSMEKDLSKAPGFVGRKIYLADRGRMAAELLTVYTREDLAKDPEPPHEDAGTQLIIIEEWESSKQRLEFSKKTAGPRKKHIVPLLLPDHSHEFYSQISVG